MIAFVNNGKTSLSMKSRRSYFFVASALALISPFLIKTNSKNTCRSFLDYALINFGGDCYYNPDVDLEVPEIIEKYAGQVKTYNVTTEDGYIVSLYRIERENPLGVILLQSPISAGAIAYLSDGANSLGIALWKKGYDVWLSNHRGIPHSRKHTKLPDTDPNFWNFGFHEIALYDLDAQLRIITTETDSKVLFFGYSMGATEALIYSSLKHENAQKFIDSYILVAPLVLFENYTSPTKYIFYAIQPFEKILRLGEMMTLDVIRWLMKFVPVVPYTVNIMSSFLLGWTPTEMDPALYPYIFTHHGRGVSHQMLYHYSQNFFNQSNFRMYNYGKETNTLVYGTDTPPCYPLHKIKGPIYFILGDLDNIATPSDVELLSKNHLPNGTVSGIYTLENHNHIDFMFSRYRKHKTYKTVFSLLDRIQNTTATMT